MTRATVRGLNDTLDTLSQGLLTPHDTVAASWARAQALQPRLQAFAFLPDAMPAPGRGPLAGIAVAVKDLIDTADMPTAYGSPAFAGHRPAADAGIVTALRDLGATVLGKTVTTEFAWQQPGPTANPWNPAHTPGGSSSGSAAAVAAGIVPLALGTQTFGSVIRPAAFCGVVGFKPTFGTLPRAGVHPLCDPLDHVGLFARTVADVEMALRLLAPAPPEPLMREGPLRLAALPPDDDVVSASGRAAFDGAVAALRAAGVAIETVSLPPAFAGWAATADTLLAYEAARHFAPLIAEHAERIGAPIRLLAARGQAVSADAFAAALAQQRTLRTAYAAWMADFDALLTVPAAGEAPEGLYATGDPRFCVPWSLTGVPALTIPVGKGPAGLPLGLQMVGRWGEDFALLGLGTEVARLFPALGVAPN